MGGTQRTLSRLGRIALSTALILAQAKALGSPDGSTGWARELSANGKRSLAVVSNATASQAIAIPKLDPRSFRRINLELRRTQAAQPAQFAAELGRAYIIVVVVMAATVAIESVRTGDRVSSNDVMNATLSVFDSAQIPLAILAFLKTHGLATAALESSLGDVMRNPTLKGAFVRFVAAQAGFLIASGAAAIAAHLVEETAWIAAESTGNPEDYARAKHPISLFSRAARALANPDTATDRDRADATLASELVAAHIYVLLTADGLRDWFSNAWRTSVATGEFIAAWGAMFPAMRAGAWVGTGARAAATALGITFGAGVAVSAAQLIAIGLTFAAIYSVLPEATKDWATRGIQTARGWANGQRISRTTLELRGLLMRASVNPAFPSAGPIDRLLAERGRAREALITAAIEKARNAVQRWTTDQRTEEAGRTARAIIEEARAQAMGWLAIDREELLALTTSAGNSGANASMRMLASHGASVERIRAFVDGLFEATSALTSATADELASDEARALAGELETSYRRGFSSVRALRALQATNTP